MTLRSEMQGLSPVYVLQVALNKATSEYSAALAEYYDLKRALNSNMPHYFAKCEVCRARENAIKEALYRCARAECEWSAHLGILPTEDEYTACGYDAAIMGAILADIDEPITVDVWKDCCALHDRRIEGNATGDLAEFEVARKRKPRERLSSVWSAPAGPDEDAIADRWMDRS